MATSSSQLESTAARTSRPRWRFSIRQLLGGIAVIAVLLFVFRELPDMIRRQVLNDPMPLHVGDRKLVHVRRSPYMNSHRNFAARVYLPPEHTYELCLGIAEEGEVYPREARVVYRLEDRESKLNPPNTISACEWRIFGFTMPEDYQNAEFSFHVNCEQMPTIGTTTSFKYHSPQKYSYSTWGQPRGWRTTDAVPASEKLILHREFWYAKGEQSQRIQSEYSPGLGLVVWLRPTPPKVRK